MAKKKTEKEPEEIEVQEPEIVAAEAEPSVEEQLQAELENSQNEAKKHQDQYLRTLADMDNLRKRTQREKEELGKFANENILREVLPVIDNLERAVEHAGQAEGIEGLLEGVRMTLDQFSQVLTRFGVVAFESIGQPFDPALHQAMGQMESAEHPVNTVVQDMQKGYQLNERLLRPAMVMIAKAPVVVEPDAETDENNPSTESDEN